MSFSNTNVFRSFVFFCGKLGHSDSFYEARMAFGYEVADMG